MIQVYKYYVKLRVIAYILEVMIVVPHMANVASVIV